MKEFSDFAEKLSKAEMMKIIEEAYRVAKNDPDYERGNNPAHQSRNEIRLETAYASMLFLRRYHDWLNGS